jgi:hypothetical protein
MQQLTAPWGSVSGKELERQLDITYKTAFGESFNGRLGDEPLNKTLFTTLAAISIRDDILHRPQRLPIIGLTNDPGPSGEDPDVGSGNLAMSDPVSCAGALGPVDVAGLRPIGPLTAPALSPAHHGAMERSNHAEPRRPRSQEFDTGREHGRIPGRSR